MKERDRRAGRWPRRLAAAVLLGALLLPSPATAADAGGAALLAGMEAPSVVVMDVLTGTVLLERDAHTPRFPASLTKIMTLLVILDAVAAGRVSLDDQVEVSAEAAGWGGTQIFLAPGEVMAFRDLLKAVAVASANDSATALAEHVAGSVDGFVAEMNRRAGELGMANTRFHNPHGIDDGLELEDHHMSAMDVAVAARELIRRHPDILSLTAIYRDKVRDPDAGQCCELVNTNRMVRTVRGVDGLKTGHTSRAGFGIAATALRDNARFLVVLMGHPSRPQRDREAARLLDWAFANWEPVSIIDAGERVQRLRVHKGHVAELDVVAGDDLGVVVPRGRADQLEQEITLAGHLTAPIDKGQVLGRLTVRHDGRPAGGVDLVAAQRVDKLTPVGLWLRLIHLTWPFR
ncbi:MAG TPA: D-alanyl-D-alanine carboxypeptidase family protein [Sphingobacteriaceae bacterium]|nr:D-alanyl-D-alanine carboxypeptidase family protein [Sphingobacteriaceae bacterium]